MRVAVTVTFELQRFLEVDDDQLPVTGGHDDRGRERCESLLDDRDLDRAGLHRRGDYPVCSGLERDSVENDLSACDRRAVSAYLHANSSRDLCRHIRRQQFAQHDCGEDANEDHANKLAEAQP